MATGKSDPLSKLSDEINRIMDEREARQRIESDPKAAGAELARDMREFLGEWKAAKAERAAKGQRPPAKADDEEDHNILSGLFGG